MISELSFAKKFTSFWNALMPGGEAYVRLINQGLLQRHLKPIDYDEDPLNRALINVVAFALFKEMVEKRSKNDFLEKIEQAATFQEIVRQEVLFLSKFSRRTEPKLPFQDSEIKSIKAITIRLWEKYKKCKFIVVAPCFQGCGILNAAEGDILIDKTLVEIKAGDRNFSIYDIRQMFVYCALNYQATNKHNIENIELFNPRVGIFFSENLDEVTKNVSGMSSNELLFEIVTFVTDNNFIELPTGLQ